MVFCLYKSYNNDNGLAHTRQNILFNMFELKYVYSCENSPPSINVALKRLFSLNEWILDLFFKYLIDAKPEFGVFYFSEFVCFSRWHWPRRSKKCLRSYCFIGWESYGSSYSSYQQYYWGMMDDTCLLSLIHFFKFYDIWIFVYLFEIRIFS